MKRRARYTNFILSTPKIFRHCYVSREEAKEVCEKSAASRNGNCFVVCCSLTPVFLISDGTDHKTMNIFNIHAFLSLTVMIIIYDQKYENGSNGRQIDVRIWSCSDGGKVLKTRLCGCHLHPPEQCWRFCCLLQATRVDSEFQKKNGMYEKRLS